MSQTVRRDYRAPDGLILAADVGGPPDAPAVILMHGGGQTRHSWSGTMESLIGEGYHVVNFDARGHGESGWSADGGYSLQVRAVDLATVVTSIGRPVALVGASMGGMTGFYAVGTGMLPQAKALVLVDIVLRPARAGLEKIRTFMRAHDAGFATLEEAAAAVAAYNPERKRPNDPAGLMKNLRLKDDGRLYWHWDPRILAERPEAERPNWTEELRQASRGITIPTLLVRGGQSDIVDDEGVAELIDLVPNTEIYDVAKAGHMVAGDRNDAFRDGVIAFLRKIRFGQAGH